MNNISELLLAQCVGIVRVFFNNWGTGINFRGLNWMYRKTGLSLFKLQSESIKGASMRAFMFILGLLSLANAIYLLFKIVNN